MPIVPEEASSELADNPIVKFWQTMTPQQRQVAEHLAELDRQEEALADVDRRLGPETEPDRGVWRLLCFADGVDASDEQLRAALPAFSLEQIAAARERVRPFVNAVSAMPEPETIDELLAEPCVSVDEAVDAGLLGVTREQWDAMLHEQYARSV